MKIHILIFLALLPFIGMRAQISIDTLAFQDFEVTPAPPVWNFTGPVIYNSGFSGAGAAPPSSPLGIGGSRAWETTVNSAGLILTFDNVIVPAGYDSVRFHFNCAAMNLIGSTGGPDDLDYVRVEYSTDGGTTWFGRLRVRGAVNNNSFWGYNGLGFGKVYYTPTTEAVFQPILSGLATTLGFANLEIVFPGTVSQVRVRMTGRSSSSSDTWMIDNVVLTGELTCSPSSSSFTASACDAYTAPSGAVYTASGVINDTIPNSTGCDSVMTITLTVNSGSSGTASATACDSYTWAVSGLTYTSSGLYSDTLVNAAGCDSILTLDLTINNSTIGSETVAICDSFIASWGTTYSSTGTYTGILTNAAGCDSTVTLDLTILNSTGSSVAETACDSYTWPQNGVTYTVSGAYGDTLSNAAGCDSIVTLNLTITTIDNSVNLSAGTLSAAAGLTYQWVSCDSGFAVIAGATSQNFTPTESGNYAVVLVSGACSDTSACTNVTVVGMEGPASSLITLSPNPSSGSFVIDLGKQHTIAKVVIRDVQGRIILNETHSNVSQLSLAMDAPAGLYVVEVIADGKTSLLKLVRE